MDEFAIWRSAEEMIRRHGEFDAMTACISREGRFRDIGDLKAVDFWHQIREAVEAGILSVHLELADCKAHGPYLLADTRCGERPQ
jgi:hypothetical protein